MTKDDKLPEGDKLDWRDEFKKTMLYTKAGSWLECSDYEGTVVEIEAFIEQAISKELKKQKEEIRGFLADSPVWDSEYIYQRKVVLLQKFDDRFDK